MILVGEDFYSGTLSEEPLKVQAQEAADAEEAAECRVLRG